MSQNITIRGFELGDSTAEIQIRRLVEAPTPDELKNYASDKELEGLIIYRETYLNKSFFPEDHIYAFDGDDMVGFIKGWTPKSQFGSGSSVAVTMPLVKLGYEHVKQMLFDHLCKSLKAQGYSSIHWSAAYRNDITHTIAKELGFEQQEGIIQLIGRLDLQDLNITEDTTIENYQDRNYPEVQKYLQSCGHNQYAIDRFFSENVMYYYEKDVLSRLISRDGNGVSFFSQGYYSHPGIATIRPILNPKVSEEENRTMLASHLATTLKKFREKGVSTVVVRLRGDLAGYRDIYEKLGFTITEHHKYTYEI